VQHKLIIAIDGPAGAGKSTIAQALARRLGYVNLESGAMYRALALNAIETGTALDDEAALFALALRSRIELSTSQAMSAPTGELAPVGAGNRVLLDGRDVTERIRQADVTDAASRVSVHPTVRTWMVERQREMGIGGGVIMEGRDIGTKVFPDAEVKVFLDAHPDVRAQRRYQQGGESSAEASAAGGAQKNTGLDAKAISQQLRQRDERDRSRAASPLEPAADAVIIDSSGMSIEQVVERVMEMVEERMRTISVQ
jgi:cytidylate kinase